MLFAITDDSDPSLANVQSLNSHDKFAKSLASVLIPNPIIDLKSSVLQFRTFVILISKEVKVLILFDSSCVSLYTRVGALEFLLIPLISSSFSRSNPDNLILTLLIY